MISRTDNHNVNAVLNKTTDAENGDFDANVLHYLKMTHPHENLQTLLEKLKALSPNTPLTLTALNKAVNVANAKMRDDPAHQEYADTVLCKMAMQLTGSNIFYTNMMNEIFFPTDEGNIELEKW